MAESADMRQIPQVSLRQILSSDPVISVVGTYSYVDGSLSWQDLAALLSIAVDRQPASVVEIGTLHGHTTRLLAINLPHAQISTIDLPPETDPDQPGVLQRDDQHLIKARRLGREFRSDPSITNVTQILGDTATIQFPRADFFYIDGAHSYDYVRNDTEKALACDDTRTVVWHDCDRFHDGVTRYLREMVQQGHAVVRIKGTKVAALFR
jgi:hypothetical protein